ncbi:MAG TPA: RluA family pseudouridine synthase [Candidatus Krumholzibacteria bacterium]|nr:RluA family pseudouridine synthase [Candidatus Krumholzibacteria bacterium]HPD71059.1 RluA family pseudouridine synthase [Candidatus Krumholzibacteria bacterium]HRY39241.1 RluA family pseudouridine synthase [Candidatus Krumholzibacteria bacterium]
MPEPAVSFLVSPAEAGQRLDVILAGRLRQLSRSQLQKSFATGSVVVDGQPRPKSYRPAAGAEIRLATAAPVAMDVKPEAIPLDIVYEDAHLLVVNKPPDLVMHPAPGHAGGTLVNALLHHTGRLAETGDPLRPGIVHRLDRDTTGLVVVALTRQAHGALAAQLKDRSLGRVYLALSWGAWPAPAGVLEGRLGRHPHDRQRMAVVQNRGRAAVTRYEVLDDLAFVQLCRVRLETGRTHQIRVHFAHFGHPVVGDPIYGDDRRARNLRPLDRAAAANLVRAARRQLLHAAALHLRHPVDQRPLEFRAPLPPDFAAALAGLRRDLGRPPSGPEDAA